MTCRPAVTLIEVLVSLFIMGVGLLALLTLFPLGTLTMAQAIKDDRAALAAANAEAAAIFLDVRHTFTTITDDSASPGGVERAFLGPRGWPDLRAAAGGLEGPSYPLYIDPFGVLAVRNQPLGAYPTLGSPGIPRRTVAAASTLPTALRWFSLLDDLNFDDSGLPARPGGQVQREARYTWAYLLRRPQAPVTSVVDLAVVVYRGRPLLVPPAESAYGPVAFDPNSAEVVVTWDPATQQRPPVRKGGWVLDATVINASGRLEPHGFFHRVVQVSDLPPVSGRPALALELETRPRVGTERGVLVVMEAVAEVFEKAEDRRP